MLKFSLTNEEAFRNCCAVVGICLIMPFWLFLFGRFAYPAIQEYVGANLADVLAYASYISSALVAIFAASVCTKRAQISWINRQKRLEVCTFSLEGIWTGNSTRSQSVGLGTELRDFNVKDGRVYFTIVNPSYRHTHKERGSISLFEFIHWIQQCHRPGYNRAHLQAHQI